MVISGKMVSHPQEQEDILGIVKKIMEEVSGEIIKKSQVGGCCNYCFLYSSKIILLMKFFNQRYVSVG